MQVQEGNTTTHRIRKGFLLPKAVEIHPESTEPTKTPPNMHEPNRLILSGLSNQTTWAST